MNKIFINYRRDDSQAESVRIYNRLTEAFGQNSVFLDIVGIPKGDDFEEAIKQTLVRSSVLLSLIGPKWLTLKDSSGHRRIDNPSDLVRQEILEALKVGIKVIPVLLGGIRMPASVDLPLEINGLATRNAALISEECFDVDMTTLIDTLSKDIGVKPNFESLKLKLVTDCRESLRAFCLLHEAMENQGARITCSLGHPGGNFRASVFYVKQADFWCYPQENRGYHKFYIPFGRGRPHGGDNNMAVQINPPHEGENKRLAGIFLSDHLGRYYIGHTGKLGGGRKGIGKTGFRRYYGPNGWLDFDRGGGVDQAIVFGPLGRDMPLDQLAKFIRNASDFRQFACDEDEGRV